MLWRKFSLALQIKEEILISVQRVITGSSSSINEVQNIVLLTIGQLLLQAFVFWMGFQERRGSQKSPQT
jgi:hypothetical protein